MKWMVDRLLTSGSRQVIARSTGLAARTSGLVGLATVLMSFEPWTMAIEVPPWLLWVPQVGFTDVVPSIGVAAVGVIVRRASPTAADASLGRCTTTNASKVLATITRPSNALDSMVIPYLQSDFDRRQPSQPTCQELIVHLRETGT